MRFIRKASYYHSFCLNFSVVICPLTNLLKSSDKFEWTLQSQQAFENVKLLPFTAPVLAAPQCDRPFKIQADAR